MGQIMGGKMGDAMQSGLQGFSDYEKQNQALRQPTGAGMPSPASPAQPVDPSYFTPFNPNQGPGTGQQGSMRARNPYFFGYGQ